MDVDPAPSRLEQLLRDERALRRRAEQREASSRDDARRWRAEAKRLEVENRELSRPLAGQFRQLVRRLLGRIRRLAGRTRPARGSSSTPRATSPQPTPARPRPAPASATRVPQLTRVQVGQLVTGTDLGRVVAECTSHDLAADPTGLFETDVNVVSQQALDQCPEELRTRFREWLELDGRQPLVWHGANPPDTTGPLLPIPPGSSLLPATFDPARNTPIGRPGRVEPTSGQNKEAFDPTDPAAVAAAARAEAVPGTPDPVRVGDARRRRAWSQHHPGSVAADLFHAAGVSFEDPTPGVAAILVSNRPDDLRRQVVAITQQAHPRLSIQVGCHGFSSTEVAASIDEAAANCPVEVIDLPAGRELGWCLNRVIETTGASILAKIDDDDHYGPGHLVDAVQALGYAGAALVGRAACFTHVEGHDRTVLRRPQVEETHTDGSLVGGTMVFRRAAWEHSPFAHRTLNEDIAFQRAIRAANGLTYAMSRWDFVYRRRSSGNTWEVGDDHFLRGAADAWPGWDPTRADLDTNGQR